MATWALEDVVLKASEHPGTFFIPPETERRAQKPGDLVRLHFLLVEPGPDGPRAERMWVEIVDSLTDGAGYLGILTNQPVHIPDLSAGDQVRFEPRHIAQTFIRKDDPRWLDCAEQGALVSRLVFEDGNTIRFAYREEPDREEDSGWRFMSGLEADEYVADPANIRICNVGWLSDMDPSLVEILRQGPGSAFERESRDAPWNRIEDWEPEDD